MHISWLLRVVICFFATVRQQCEEAWPPATPVARISPSLLQSNSSSSSLGLAHPAHCTDPEPRPLRRDVVAARPRARSIVGGVRCANRTRRRPDGGGAQPGCVPRLLRIGRLLRQPLAPGLRSTPRPARELSPVGVLCPGRHLVRGAASAFDVSLHRRVQPPRNCFQRGGARVTASRIVAHRGCR